MDFLFPFGKRIHAEDFHFSAFKHRTRLSNQHRKECPRIPELSWSGRDLSICYNLKSVERSGNEDDPRWSIRHCVISHTFDVDYQRQNWTILKSGMELQDRITSATGGRSVPNLYDFSSIDRAFAASFAVHLLVCDWSVENWRWYINSLEQSFKDVSDRIFVDDLNFLSMSPMHGLGGFDKHERAKTNLSSRSGRAQTSKKKSRLTILGARNSRGKRPVEPTAEEHADLATKDPLPAGIATGDIEIASSDHSDSDYERDRSGLKFHHLQTVLHIHGKANEAALVIEHNLNILLQLREHYRHLLRLKDFPQALKQDCEEDIGDFELRVKGVENDFRIQKARLGAILSLIDDRKDLVSGALRYPYFGPFSDWL